MNLTRVKKALAHANLDELGELKAWLVAREAEMAARGREFKREAAWQSLQPINVGDKLYAHGKDERVEHIWRMKGNSFVRPHTGRINLFTNTLNVRLVQPRAKRIWVELGATGQVVALGRGELIARDVHKQPHPDQITEAILDDKDGKRAN